MCFLREPVVAVRGTRAARTGASWEGGRGAKRRVSGDGHAIVAAEDSSVALPSARLRSGVRGERSEPSPDSELLESGLLRERPNWGRARLRANQSELTYVLYCTKEYDLV